MRINMNRKKIWFRENGIYLALLALITAMFSLIYFNRFAPDTMGWQLYNAILMDKGEMVYRDFFNYLPPGSLFRTMWSYQLTGGGIVGYRFICIMERVLLTSVLFGIMSKYFPAKFVWFSCTIGAILTSTTVVDQFGDYNQTYKLYLLVGTYFGIKFFENIKNKRLENVYMLFCGIALGMVMLYKQSVGLIAPGCFVLMLIIYCIVEKNKSFVRYLILALSGYGIPTGICAIWLASRQALVPFFDQVYGSVVAKGDPGSLLLRFWKNIMKPDCLMIVLPLLLMIIIGKYLQGMRDDETKRREWLLLSLWVTVGFEVLFITQKYGVFIAKFLFASTTSGFIYVFLGMALVGILLWKNGESIFGGKGQGIGEDKLKACMLGAILLFFIYLFSCLSPEMISNMHWESDFFGAKEDLPILMAYIIVFVLGNSFIYYIIKKRPRNSLGYMLMVLGFFVVIYEAGMATGTTGLTYITTAVSAPFAVCILLNYQMPYQKIKNVVVVGAGILLCTLSMGQKLTQPYSWWGWANSPISQADQYTIDVPRMEGFKVSLDTKVTYEETVRLITENSKTKDFVLTFPHMKLFNILADRMESPTFVVSYFFDVCPDKYAIRDAEIIRKNPPKIVIMNEYDEEFWNYNEHAFRNGEKSGQRKIIEWFEEHSEGYKLIGKVHGLEIYRILDGTPINYTYYDWEEDIYATATEPEDSTFSIVDILITQMNIGEDAFPSASKSICISLIFIGSILAFFLKEKWKIGSYIVCIVGICLRISPLYFLGFVIPLLIWGIDKKTKSKTNYIYMVLIMLMLASVLLLYTSLDSIIQVISIVLLVVLYGMLTVEGGRNFYERVKAEPFLFLKFLLLTIGTVLIFCLSQVFFTQTPWWSNPVIPLLTNTMSLEIFGLLSLLAWFGGMFWILKKRGNHLLGKGNDHDRSGNENNGPTA